MTNKYNELEICVANYTDDRGYGREPEFREVEMISDIADFVKVLLKNGQQVKLWYDGLTVCIEYNYLDKAMTGVRLEWVGPNEYVETYATEEESREE